MNTSWTCSLSQHGDHVDGLRLVQGGELFLRWSPGSSHQFSCGFFATSPDMYIHNPLRNWHEPKHFIKEYSSATVVDRTAFFIFQLSQSIRLPYVISSLDDRSRDSATQKKNVIPRCDGPLPPVFPSSLRRPVSNTARSSRDGMTYGSLIDNESQKDFKRAALHYRDGAVHLHEVLWFLSVSR